MTLRFSFIRSPESDLEKRGTHFFWLDWLRFGAAFLVLICHSRNNTWVAWKDLTPSSHTPLAGLFFALNRLGYEAVILFFVLSGFFVGGSGFHRLLREKFRLADYALDRLTRIYLPLFPALLLTALVGWALAQPLTGFQFLGACLGWQGIITAIPGFNAPLWSLADEIWFYLALGFLALAWTGRTWQKITGLVGGALCLAAFWQLGLLYLACWLLGAAGSFLPARNFFLWLGFLVAGLGLVMRQLTAQSISLTPPAWLAHLSGETASTLILALGIAFLLPSLGRLTPVSGWSQAWDKMGQTLAAFFYTLYLTHFPLLCLSHALWPEHFTQLDFVSLAWFGSNSLACLVVAYLLYLLFEAQTSRLRHRLKSAFLSTGKKTPCFRSRERLALPVPLP